MIKIKIPSWLADSEKLPREIEGEIISQTEKAILFEMNGRSSWLPKSQITIEGEIPQERPKAWVEGTTLKVQCSFSEREKAKQVPGWDWNKTSKTWDFPIDRRTIKALKASFGENLEIAPELLAPPQDLGEVPAGLFPFQIEGVKFLLDAERVLLGDDMGLGKTVQAIVACIANKSEKILVLCPNSLKWNWEREFKKWAPNFSITIIHGDRATRTAQFKSQSNVKVVNLELLRHSSSEDQEWSSEVVTCMSQSWDTLIIDEAHRIKNRAAQVSKASKKISPKAKNVFLLTGTPITNRPDELWSLLSTIYPKQFSSYWKFVEAFCHVSHNGYGFEVGPLRLERVEALKTLISPFVLRRTKKAVMSDLPPKMIQQIWVDLEKDQRDIYDQMARDAWAKVSESQEISAAIVLAQITRLKQITVDPQLTVQGTKPLDGAKVDALLEIFESSGEQKLVVFSQFSQALSCLSKRLDLEGLDHTLLTGEVSGIDRQKAVDRFQIDPTCRAILVTIRAGGVGLTLTAGSIAVFLDKAWTPADNIQAQDRLHRYGQTSPVTIIELLAQDTVDETIEDLLNSKAQDFKNIFGQDDVETQMSGTIQKQALINLLQRGERKNAKYA